MLSFFEQQSPEYTASSIQMRWATTLQSGEKPAVVGPVDSEATVEAARGARGETVGVIQGGCLMAVSAKSETSAGADLSHVQPL